MLRLINNPNWANRHFLFAESLPGALEMGGENDMPRNCSNRHNVFLNGLRDILGIQNTNGRFWGNANTVLYGTVVSSLNRRQLFRLGVHTRDYHTTWKGCVGNVRGFMAQENRNEREFEREMENYRRRFFDAMFGDVADQWMEQLHRGYESPPLCIPVGRRLDELAVLIIYKEGGMWKSILKHFRNGRNIRPAPIVFHILKALKIDDVKVVPGIGGLMHPLFTDELKECYKVCATMFDGHQEFNVWKDTYYQHLDSVYDVKTKRSLADNRERARLRRNN